MSHQTRKKRGGGGAKGVTEEHQIKGAGSQGFGCSCSTPCCLLRSAVRLGEASGALLQRGRGVAKTRTARSFSGWILCATSKEHTQYIRGSRQMHSAPLEMWRNKLSSPHCATEGEKRYQSRSAFFALFEWLADVDIDSAREQNMKVAVSHTTR